MKLRIEKQKSDDFRKKEKQKQGGKSKAIEKIF